MKTTSIIYSGAIAATLLTACLDRKVLNGPTDKGDTPSIVITQPSRKDSIPQVVETLRESFNRVAHATSGARVPNPHITILLADATTVDVPAPKAGNAAFGESTPKARQARMEGQLNALAEKLTAGCNGTPVPSQVVKQTVNVAFKEGGYEAWAAGGGGSLWTAKSEKESAPASFIQDGEAFAKALGDESKKGGSYLILMDSTGVVPPKTAPKKAVTTGKPKPNSPRSSARPQLVAGAKPPVDAGVQGTPETGSARPGGNISINVSYPPSKDGGKTATPESAATPTSVEPVIPLLLQYSAVKLPDGAEPVGEPILFAPGSAKLTDEGHETIKKAAAVLKTTDGVQVAHVFLVGSADASLDEKLNKELSEQRADTVRIALLRPHGITVQQTYAIGENLAPDKASVSERARHRFVQMYVLRNHTMNGVAHASAVR